MLISRRALVHLIEKYWVGITVGCRVVSLNKTHLLPKVLVNTQEAVALSNI